MFFFLNRKKNSRVFSARNFRGDFLKHNEKAARDEKFRRDLCHPICCHFEITYLLAGILNLVVKNKQYFFLDVSDYSALISYEQLYP